MTLTTGLISDRADLTVIPAPRGCRQQSIRTHVRTLVNLGSRWWGGRGRAVDGGDEHDGWPTHTTPDSAVARPHRLSRCAAREARLPAGSCPPNAAPPPTRHPLDRHLGAG